MVKGSCENGSPEFFSVHRAKGSRTVADNEDTRRYRVVVNDEDQYSIWFADRELPNGWHAEGTEGTKPECVAHIDQVWTDMRPRSVRAQMGES
jgi:MbtH protein